MTIDVLFYNIKNYYADLDFLGSLEQWNKNYIERGQYHFWRGYSPENNGIESKLRPLDQFCFSSQFYFISYLGCTALMFVIIGLMILLEAKADPFGDTLVLPLMLINLLVIIAIEKISLYLRRVFKIWEVNESDLRNSKTSGKTNDNKIHVTEVILTDADDMRKASSYKIMRSKASIISRSFYEGRIVMI